MTGRCGQEDLNPPWSFQRLTEISDEVIPIEDLSPSTGKFNRSQTPKSTKFSDAPESMRTCTAESSNVPGTTADPKLDGAEARKVRCTDGTGAVIAAEATSFDESLDRQIRAKWPFSTNMTGHIAGRTQRSLSVSVYTTEEARYSFTNCRRWSPRRGGSIRSFSSRVRCHRGQRLMRDKGAHAAREAMSSVKVIKNSKSLLECPTITALVAAFDAKAFNDTELLKSYLADGNRIINFCRKTNRKCHG